MESGRVRRSSPSCASEGSHACCSARRKEAASSSLTTRGEIGPDLFRAACNMGLEGMVSKRADRPYLAGRCTHWVKVKNRKHPAYRRVQDRF